MPTSPATPPRVNPTPPVVTALPFGLLVIDIQTISRNRTRVDRYFLEKIEGIDDLAFTLKKVNPRFDGTDKEVEAYDINLTAGTCECRGFLRWNACKHLGACREAYEAGRLPS
jgi:hypothetical protein